MVNMSKATNNYTRITTNTLAELKSKGRKIAMLTAYDYTMAGIVDKAGVDVILVGDSASNVMAGHETTLPITLDQMIYHAASVVRGVKRALVVVDLPFGAYQADSKEALPIVFQETTKTESSSIDFKSFKKKWKAAKKKIVLVGVNTPGVLDSKWMEYFDDDPSVILLTETTSNLRSKDSINSIDSLIAPLEMGHPDFFSALHPDILLTFGGMVVSKKIKKFLREFSPKEHWHVDPLRAYDTYYCLSHHFQMPVNSFFSKLLEEFRFHESDFKSIVLDQYQKQLEQGDAYLNKIGFSDLKAFKTIFSLMPGHIQLQLANSSTVRYSQLFDLPHEVDVFCNRGTSGIDGSTATAVGASLMSSKPCLLITGDLSFFYDINGLWNNYLLPSFRIIVINNGGGGIFRILPGEKDSPKYDTYFETIHHKNVRQLAKAFGFKYKSVSNNIQLKWALKSFYKPSNQPKILEIKTPRKINDEVLLNYFKAMQKS